MMPIVVTTPAAGAGGDDAHGVCAFPLSGTMETAQNFYG
jgi:hypothetical protein